MDFKNRDELIWMLTEKNSSLTQKVKHLEKQLWEQNADERRKKIAYWNKEIDRLDDLATRFNGSDDDVNKLFSEKFRDDIYCALKYEIGNLVSLINDAQCEPN